MKGNLEVQLIENVEQLEKKWKNSKFIDCLGLNVSTAKRVIPEKYVHKLVIFRDFVEKYHSSLVIFGGTLLG